MYAPRIKEGLKDATSETMLNDDIVVRTRLIPPRLPRRWLRRPRLDRLLAAAAEHPLTIVCASAGYGKSSALASFAARGGWPTIWYSMGHSGDPLVFLLHLIHACRTVAPQAGERAITLLEQRASGALAWRQALDALINSLVSALDDETIVVLDDYHAVDDLPDIRALIERFIMQRPPRLHIVLATRHWPQLACLPALQARGELFALAETDLSFTDEEIAELFADAYQSPLSAAESLALGEQTGGWAIALQLLGHSAATAPQQRTAVDRALSPPHAALTAPLLGIRQSREVLFDYLAQEVFARQPDHVQALLLRSAIFAEIEPSACAHVLGEDSAAQLPALEQHGLFLARVGETRYRYHPLFHAFLQARAQTVLQEWADLHRRAGAYFQAAGAGEQALHHLLALNDTNSAVAVIEQYAGAWLASGRYATLLAWIERLPAATLQSNPRLLIASGDAARLLARFDQAIETYVAAERINAARGDAIGEAQALRGQALVYIDTVQPALAEGLLRRAFKLLPTMQREERAELLDLLAENRLNRGRADQSARLYRVAGRLRGATLEDPARRARVLLRLGKLAAARALLESSLADDALAPQRPAEAHREATVLLSLICALLGEGQAAYAYAQQGLEAARRMGAALFEAVAHMRAGHALQLLTTPDPPAANQHYMQAIVIAEALGLERTKAEAYTGMTLLHGFSGDLAAAEAAARVGLAIIERSGDEWAAALQWAALGAVGVAAGAENAAHWLHEAYWRYQRGKDAYGQAVTQLWLAIHSQRAGQPDAGQHAIAALALADQHGYHGLLTTITLLGPRDRMMLVPVLLATRADARQRHVAQALLARSFPAITADEATQHYHPGSTLRIRALGRLRVWRGGAEVEPREWQRKKAPQMLGLLLTNRHRWLPREHICEWLWPDAGPAEAETQFKVTLNALNNALEPARPPRTPPFYIRRQGSAYRFAPPDGVWFDVEEFEALLNAAQSHLAAGDQESLIAAQQELAAAIELYRDAYLSDWLYEDWAREERARLDARSLDAATTLADLYLGRGHTAEAIRLGELILSRDPCWEPAYAILMRAYARQGNRRLAVSTYERCVRNLRERMDVAPLPETTRMYEEARA